MQSKAFRLISPGNPASLTLVEEAVPAPAPGEVLVRVVATSLNFRDLMIFNGWLPFPVKAGLIPLTDAAGEIVAVGERVSRFAVGDRVTNSYYPDWHGGPLRRHPAQYATALDGWLTTYKIVPEQALSHIPAHLDYEEAATLPCAGVTAWSAITGVTAGDTVLTQGSGGVSLFAMQLARSFGARIIATTTSITKAEKLKALGADEVIDVKAHPEWACRVRELTNGAGADRIIDVGGPGTLAQSIQAVAVRGQVSLIGALAAGDGQPGIDFMSLFISQARYECIGVGSRADLEELTRVLERHALRPVIDSVFDFDDFGAAVGHFSGRNLFGKVVIRHHC